MTELRVIETVALTNVAVLELWESPCGQFSGWNEWRNEAQIDLQNQHVISRCHPEILRRRANIRVGLLQQFGSNPTIDGSNLRS